MAGSGGPYLERAAELSWIADFEDAVASDLSVFHRIDAPLASIGSAHLVRLAEYLPAYNGAVAACLRPIVEAEHRSALGDAGAMFPADPDHYPSTPSPVPAIESAPSTNDIASLAAASQRDAGWGIPTIEYLGG